MPASSSPASVPDGTDRIRIFLPGVTDPERVTAIFARKVKVSFRQIDVSMPPEQVQSGTPPTGTEVLPGFKDKRPYLVAKDSVLDGDDISYAGPGFASGTKDPIASFRFNGRGTRRFAHVTEENIGRPFAIVLDGKVISAPVIREPITGGSGQISGNFTLEEANSVAMLLRAGSLPGHLDLVEQQVVPARRQALRRRSPRAPPRRAPDPSRRPRSRQGPHPGGPNHGRATAIRTTNGQLPKRPIRLKFASCGMAAEGFIQAVVIRFRL